MADGTPEQSGQVEGSVAQVTAEPPRRKGRPKLRYRLTTSGLVKDAAVGGVAFVAVRITFMYLKAFGQRPDLLAGLGTKLIVDILLIAIIGVIINRAVDIFGGTLDRSADSLDRALDRMAESSERTARSAASAALAQQETASAQREIAASQHALALAQRDQTSVMERVAAAGDNTLTEVQTLQNYQVSQGKMLMREMRRNQQYMIAVMDKVGAVKPAVPEEDQSHA